MRSSTSVRLTFRKPERLVSKTVFETLFKSGTSRHDFPIRMVWVNTSLPSASPVQVAFSVSKRNFKRAVDRNRIKRLMREAYRQNKNELYSLLQKHQKQMALLLIFTGKSTSDYTVVLEKIKVLLQHLVKSIEQNHR